MKLLKKQFCILIACISIVAGCISDFKVNISDSSEGVLVVEGYILENSDSKFSFSKSFSMSESGPPAGYDEVQVNLYVVGDNGYRSEAASYLGKGVHQIKVGKLDDHVSYGIEFEYNGDTYHSNLTKPVYTPPIDSISWSQPREYGDVSIQISTHNDAEKTSYFTWKYTEDWEIRVSYQVEVIYNEAKREFVQYEYAPRYYCWRKNEGHDILIGSTETFTENRLINHKLYNRDSSTDRFSVLYSTSILQRGLSKAGYEYYLDLQKSNEEMGGLFSSQPSGIEGNITCVNDPSKKIIGFIEVNNNVEEEQLYINSRDILRKPPSLDCPTLGPDSVAGIMERLEIGMYDLLNLGYHPILSNMERPSDSWEWTYTTCLNCVTIGGTKNKPDFWPNDHK